LGTQGYAEYGLLCAGRKFSRREISFFLRSTEAQIQSQDSWCHQSSSERLWFGLPQMLEVKSTLRSQWRGRSICSLYYEMKNVIKASPYPEPDQLITMLTID
jgi:hypothetical protein